MRDVGSIPGLTTLELPREHINMKAIECVIKCVLCRCVGLKRLNLRGKVCVCVRLLRKPFLFFSFFFFSRWGWPAKRS